MLQFTSTWPVAGDTIPKQMWGTNRVWNSRMSSVDDVNLEGFWLVLWDPRAQISAVHIPWWHKVELIVTCVFECHDIALQSVVCKLWSRTKSNYKFGIMQRSAYLPQCQYRFCSWSKVSQLRRWNRFRLLKAVPNSPIELQRFGGLRRPCFIECTEKPKDKCKSTDHISSYLPFMYR